MLNCQQVTKLLSESQEHPLTLQQRMALRIHLFWCSGCRTFDKQIHSLRVIARSYAKNGDDDHHQS